uniref:Gamma-tubulin complex component n=1 Tax=Clastoptera arizonana TaxID=38151 RepID=A0A1B6D4Y5_9HEMI
MDLCIEVNDKSISVYNEISNLCQTLVRKYDIDERRKKNLVKNLRSNAFNKLLFCKNIVQNKEDIDDDPNFIITDIFFKIHCLATKNQYNFNNRTKQHTFKLLEDMHEALQSNPNLTAVLQFLLLLADSRNKDEDEEEPSIGLDMRKLSKRNFLDPPQGILAVPPDSLFDYLQTVDDFYEKKLKKINVVYESEPGTGLSEYFSFMSKRADNLYNNEGIEEDSNNIVWRFPPSNINLQIPNSITSAHADEGYFTPDIDQAWEVEVATTKLDYWNDSLLEPSTSLLTWETLGSSYTHPEKKYITQIKDGIFHFVRSLKQFPNNDDIQVQITDVSKEVFNRDILYLLIAVESSTFLYNQESNSFMMKPGVFINGLSPNLLNSYCEEAIRCGNSYLKLNNLVKEEIQNAAKSKQSLIFMALCRCVQRYLQCYVGTILKIPSSEGLVKMNHWIVALRTQLEFLVEICCKNSSEESGKLPHGGALLLYIYEKVSEVVRQDLGYILHFILYSCSVVYFRILEKWIFEGVCDDPHGEFFIEAKPTNEVTYDRLFWTRSCVLNRMMVPRFLKDLENDLFVCGKSIRLLKLCNVKVS